MDARPSRSTGKWECRYCSQIEALTHCTGLEPFCELGDHVYRQVLRDRRKHSGEKHMRKTVQGKLANSLLWKCWPEEIRADFAIKKKALRFHIFFNLMANTTRYCSVCYKIYFGPPRYDIRYWISELLNFTPEVWSYAVTFSSLSFITDYSNFWKEWFGLSR